MKFKPRRRSFIFFALILVAVVFYTVHVLSSMSMEDTSNVDYKNEVERLRNQIQFLEKKASENENNYKNLEKIYKQLEDAKKREQAQKPAESPKDGADDQQNQNVVIQPPIQREQNHEQPVTPNKFFSKLFIDREEKIYSQQCDWFQEHKPSSSDINAEDLYEKLTFDDIDGGVWKQGFDITYDEDQWTQEKKLQVFVVPHSHNDPGWIMTFEEYFRAKTKHIFDTIVESLSEKETRKFIWAETSYLSLWWNQADEDKRTKFRRLVLETGQLEIVTGGWVMPDESSSHYYALIEQMIEGHEWLKANIDPAIRPSYGWSIDPFGYTPTIAYLLKQMGFDAMLIQRVHYHVKKYLAQTQRFEFNWRQSWSTDKSKETDIFCHVMPFYSYDIPHTCGPDPKICCQFDFKRLPGSSVNCPWGVPPQAITDHNVEDRAKMLLDQYRKKAQLYGGEENHNVVLIPLGDDFRYTDMKEARDQFTNYERLMEFMNAKKEWNVEVKFGTLRDYFEVALRNKFKSHKRLETFSGDFFTYADRQDHYWSGYFTSRPYYKRLDRLVEYYLRSAEILFSFSNVLQSFVSQKFSRVEELYKKLLTARRNLGIYQHHDGIAGTAKTHVNKDYERMLRTSLETSKEIIENAASYLITPSHNAAENIFSIDDARLGSDLVVKLIGENDQQKIVLFNPSLTHRVELISIKINTPDVEIVDSDGNALKDYQISLMWPNMDIPTDFSHPNRIESDAKLSFALDFDQSYYELLFDVNIAPLGMKTLKIIRKSSDKVTGKSVSKVTFYSSKAGDKSVEDEVRAKIKEKSASSLNDVSGQISFKSLSTSESESNVIEVQIDEKFQARFSRKTGLLREIVSDTKKAKLNIKLVKYGTTTAREKSGAYLFLPDGPAVNVEEGLLQWVRVEEQGSKRHRVCVNMTLVLHCVEFYPSLTKARDMKYPLISIWNVVDLRASHNYELAVLFTSDINNENVFHTDLNGFQYTRRKTYSKIPLQGNVYPMPTGAFIQDEKLRLNLLSAQPLGVASLHTSELQVFLDRRLDQDDNRGLEQAANDNVVTGSRFLLFFEVINGVDASFDKAESITSQYPTLFAQWMSFDLLNPVVKLGLTKPTAEVLQTQHLANTNKNMPCDLRLVNLRTMQTRDEKPLPAEVGLILHRVPYEDCPSAPIIQLSSYVHKQCDIEKDNQLTFGEFFDFFGRAYEQFSPKSPNIKLNINNTLLTLTPKNLINPRAPISKLDPIHNFVQPMQIEAFRITFS